REVRLSTILDTVDEGILTVDPSLRIESANTAAERMIGTELSGRPLLALWPEPDREVERQRLLALVRDQQFVGGRARGEALLRGRYGPSLPAEITSSPMMIRGQSRLLLVIRDMTEIQRSRAEERRLAEELAQTSRMEALGTLASGIAHDFNNLLMALG